MGEVDVICSDKTGTLTYNELTLAAIWNSKFVNLINFY